MKIAKETIITMDYTLKDGSGNLLETTLGKKPVKFIFGSDMILPSLEKSLVGLEEGDEKTVIVQPDEGYGKKNQDLVIKVHRSELAENVEEIKVGYKFRRISLTGESTLFRISGFIGDWVFLDGNHLWAGLELHYDVKILHVSKNMLAGPVS